MTGRIEVAERGRVQVIRIDDGRVNTLDIDLLRGLRELIEQVPEDRAVVLTGNDRAFSAGIDLKALLSAAPGEGDELVLQLEALVRTIALARVPIVGAISGHAIGGGCLLALACHYRVMGEGKIGLVESIVGFPIPPISLDVVRRRLGAFVERAVFGAGTIRAEKAEQTGFIDEHLPSGDVVARSEAIGLQLSGPGRAAFVMHQAQLRAGMSDAFDDAVALHTQSVLAVWRDAEVRRNAADYLAQLGR